VTGDGSYRVGKLRRRLGARPIDWKWLRDGAHRRGAVAMVVAPNPVMVTVSFSVGADNQPRGGLEGGGRS
jgi:hypothetical protein